MERFMGTHSVRNYGMNCRFVCTVFIVLTLVIRSSLEYSHEEDSCTMYDTCGVKQFFRTCSCESDCYRYGTCCRDSEEFNQMRDKREEFQCYDEGTPSPVFAKRTCDIGWNDDPIIQDGCVKQETINTTSDFMSQVLVSSNRTETTYWNWNCALCNGEDANDLIFWTVQVSCFVDGLEHHLSLPQAKANMAYNESGRHWGVHTNREKFIPCSVSFFQPAFLMGRLRLCAPNMISSCPSSWKDSDVEQKCLSYHAERKNKQTGLYFRNKHCAKCNGMAIKELMCLGRNYRATTPIEDSRVLKVVFNLNSWTGEHGEDDKECLIKSRRYDPFLRICRDLSLGITNNTLESVDYELLGSMNKASLSSPLFPVWLIMVATVHCFGK